LDCKTKSFINLNLLVTDYNKEFEEFVQVLRVNNLEVNVFQVTGENNYMGKIHTAIKNSATYSVSIDEDIFIPCNAWQYFLNHIEILDDVSNMILSPTITTGIPSVDIFAENFLTQPEREKLESLYSDVIIPNIWGADYSSLVKHTHNTKWCSTEFYKEVSKIDHHYRGVHPVRFSHQAQKFINDICIENIDKICNINEFSIVPVKRPYFCNSVFGIRTELWELIVHDKSLFRDEFDEVPMNLYMREHDLNLLFINNGFAIHPSYNTIDIYGHKYSDLSDEFFHSTYFQ
jgi:hypothetical protein